MKSIFTLLFGFAILLALDVKGQTVTITSANPSTATLEGGCTALLVTFDFSGFTAAPSININAQTDFVVSATEFGNYSTGIVLPNSTTNGSASFYVRYIGTTVPSLPVTMANIVIINFVPFEVGSAFSDFNGTINILSANQVFANGIWNNASTWCNNVVPGALEEVVIQSGRTVSVTGNIDDLANVTIESGGTLDIRNNGNNFNELHVEAGGVISQNGTRELNVSDSLIVSSEAIIGITGAINEGVAVSEITLLGDDARNISPPFSSFDAAQLDAQLAGGLGASNNRLFQWSESGNAWSEITSGTITGAGQGYAFRTGATSSLSLVGAGFNDAPITLSNLTKTGTEDRGYHLVGNPYLGPILWSNVTRNGIRETYYIRDYDVNNSANSVWLSYNATSGLPVNVGGDSSDATNVIAPWQGFWVKNDNTVGNPASLTFEPSDIDVAQAFSLKSPQVSPPNYAILSLKDPLVQTNIFDKAYLRFSADWSDSLDAGDGEQRFADTSAIAHIVVYPSDANTPLQIGTYGLIQDTGTYTVQLGVHAPAAGTYELEVKNLSSFSDSTELYIKDGVTNTLHDLRNDQVFMVRTVGSVGRGDADHLRYSLVVAKRDTAVVTSTTLLETQRSPFHVFSSGNQIVVLNKENSALSGSIEVRNTLGQHVARFELRNEELARYALNTDNGIYLVTVTEQNSNTRKTYKLYISQ